MYNDEIKVANKIITDKVLSEIFQKMDEDLRNTIELSNKEKSKNSQLDREEQHWDFKNFEGGFKCTIDFYDDASVTIDNYNQFSSVFNTRIQDIKHLWVRYYNSYMIGQTGKYKSVIQHIHMQIYENKMSIDVKLSSADKNMNSVYEFIKEKIHKAPAKYSKIIKKKKAIENKTVFSIGLIPSLLLCTLFMLVPSVRHANSQFVLLYPVAVLLLGYFFGSVILGSKLDELYKHVIPDKKYSYYDHNKHKSIYKDDIDKFLSTSEVLIGKNVNNLKYRKEISKIDKKYRYIFPIEISILVVMSIIFPLIATIMR